MTVALEGSAPSGLASLVAELIGQNLARDPSRASLLRRTVAVLDAVDAGVVAHLRIASGAVRGGDGEGPDAHVRIRADSERLLALTAVPLRLGLPDLATAEGRLVVRDLLARRLQIRGLLRHPVRLARVASLLSVRDGDPG